MNDFLIFGGTTEGRLLAEYCDKNGISCVVSIATEYGGSLLPVSDRVKAEVGRKDRREIAEFISSGNFAAVFDATHPYAEEAGRNIAEACIDTDMPYYRIVRDMSPVCKEALYFDSAASAAEFAEKEKGNIFIATGSKELHLFCRQNMPSRCTVRVLPDEKLLHDCKAMGFKRVIGGRGPFEFEENCGHFRGCDIIITKESGVTGGFEEKRRAAAAVGARLFIIRRPEEKGMKLSQAYELLSRLSEENSEKERG